MKDVAPELMEKLRSEFESGLMRDQVAEELLERIQDGKGSYVDAGRFAERVGESLANALGKVLTADTLPDGKMYWNIAQRAVRPVLEEAWLLVAEATLQVQTRMNKAAGLGVQAVRVPVDADRLKGLMELLCREDADD